MEIFDLMMEINKETPTFPDDPKQEITQIATIEKDGVSQTRLTFTTHFSTHIDVPIHMLEGGKTLSDFPINKFIGDAVVIDVRGQKEINADLNNVKANDIVFLLTGHTNNRHSDKFFKENPVMSKEITQKLIEYLNIPPTSLGV